MAHEHTHHHHHHDYAKANADHFSEQASNYRTELSIEIAKRCAAHILKKYPFDSNKTELLDFACGPGLIAFELLPNVKRIVGADSAPGMVEVFNRTVTEQGLSTEKIHCVEIGALKGDESDLDGALFDVIICVQSYHHFEDPIQITKAFAQRLKPNGRLIVIDFADAGNIETFFEKVHEHKHEHEHIVAHKHGFTYERMIEIFKAGNLQNPQVEEAFNMPKSEMKTYQAHERMAKVMECDFDFTFHYFIAYADKA
ncbi:unnamed protein product [Rotaria socialis]|uniref:Methyltransferase type 11 domain-containing protein n=1 Tax=Rotaria socialis TaxID=392032 RepID=A0A820PEB0_9BILA|nr:unnamed protein product [Rotaria socialis]CAF3467285.1 unnamed protein product [Rotaria socialis]CAF3639830.1 unnamed protein product [Rotaria socialis]CAF4358077.1 unnamed protein product [Rotaria socialis]CAF4401626.1 unnamed protein product [Rotaria socialis]